MTDKHATLLLVDDVPANTRTAARVLEHYGYHTVAAHSGKEALAMVMERHVDLILLDIMMPEMNGFETCEKLKRDSRSSDIPIIFLTALGDVDSITKGFEVGGVDYVVKPFRRAELVMRVKTHLELRQLQSFFEESSHRLHEKHIILERQNQELNAVASRIETYLRKPLDTMAGVIETLHACCQTRGDTEALGAVRQLAALREQMAVDMEALQIMAAVKKTNVAEV